MSRWFPNWSKKPTSNETIASTTTNPSANTSTTTSSLRKTFPAGISSLHTAENSVVDIVFVHGLTGDREKTWTAKNAPAPWPQSLLPSKVPNARVLTFGYDAYVVDWKGVVSKSRIGNHAMNLLTSVATYRENDDTNERPIIFVCHSLGGLVCEDALSLAQQRPEKHLRNILNYTRGIVFLGTPHHGSGLAQWAERLAKTIGVLKQTNPNILEVLKSDSEVLARVQDGFHTMVRSRNLERLPPIEITCFYEELPLVGIGTVVPSHSAILPGYIPIGIRSNHMDMTKFADEDDPGFVAVAGELRRWVKEVMAVGNTNLPVAPSIQERQGHAQALQQVQQDRLFLVPYMSNPGFVGRSDILKKVENAFRPSLQQKQSTSQARAALFGLGGIGKTQIALGYAYWLKEECPEVSIFWVHASNAERYHQAIFQIAESYQIPGHKDPKADVVRLVKEWLERKDQRPWLMIIDNADDSEVFFSSGEVTARGAEGQDGSAVQGKLGHLIPRCPHGAILVTTRNKQTGSKLTGGRSMINVGPMNEEESIQLISKRLEDNGLDTKQTSLLADRLDYLPLALVQAAAFIQENSMTVPKYIKLLDHGDHSLVELLSQPFEEEGRDSSVPNAVTATWIVSFNQIDQQYPYAGNLLSLMSFFDRQGIPKLLLTYHQDKGQNQQDYQQEQLGGQEAAVELEKALGVLKAFSFISESEVEDNLNMHRLTQLVMRKWLISEGKAQKWGGIALCNLSALFPNGEQAKWTICAMYLPHVYAVLDQKGSISTKAARAEAKLQHKAALFMLHQGQWNKAEEFQVQAVKGTKVVLGEEHPSTLTSMANLASTYRRVLGEEHPSTLTSMANLASTYRNQGR
ncbi:uncharacterized protein BDR25DRAFT_278738 [Lindgomyces ingoldianus]|uniref:Uncharacterized protein n=1 Tax=Lindgomyces ingoldianus TaxID=673940 RepID=A0ACB6RB57_9PLEO|nr:uncharacterized protein BDR25DRAFT_278738 [Lindgomyces ingoldianus]KAF2475988.1 hypothetical protein BDR25DRAFT_278738 [Lindgomyces ingoldianus]